MGVFFSKSKEFKTYDEFVQKSRGNYGYEDTVQGKKPLGVSIFQAETQLPVAQGRIIQTGSWIINGMPAGLIFREGKNGTHFTDYDPFLLHTVNGGRMNTLEFRLNQKQRDIRAKLYNGQVVNDDIYTKFNGNVRVVQTEQVVNLVGDAISIPYQNWNSYKAIQQTIRYKEASKLKVKPLTDNDLNIIRGRYLIGNSYMSGSQSTATVNAYFNKHPMYILRKFRLGYFSTVD